MDFDDRLHSSLTSPLLTGTSPLHSARLLHRSPRGGFLAPRTTHYFSNPISANELSPTQDFRQLDSRRSSISLDQPFSILPSAAAGGQPITHSNDASMWSSSMEVKLPFEATPSPSNSFHGMQMQLQQPNQQQRMPQIFNFAQANTHSPPVPAHPLAQSQLNQQQQQQPLQQNIIAPQVGLKGAKLDELTPFTVPTTNYTQSYQQLLLQQQQQQQLMQQLTAATLPHLSPFQTNLSNSDEHQLHATPPSTSSALSMQSPLVSVMSSDSMASSPQISLLQQQLAGMPHSLQMHGMAPQSMAASIAMPPLHPQLQSFIIPPMQSPQQVLHGNRAMPTLATILPGAAPILAATISTDSLKMPIMARTVSEERKANGNVSSKKDKSSNNNQQQMSGVQPAKTTASTPELVASFTSPLARPLDSLPSSSSSNTLNVGVGTPLMPGAFDQQASNKSPSPFALARSSPSSASASPATALSETIGGLQPQSIVNVSNILAGIASPAPLGKRTVKATQAALAANEEKNKAANARAKKQTEGNGNAHKKQDASESIPSAPAVVRGQSGSKVKNESAVKKESPVAEEKKSKKAAEKSKKKKRREDDSEDDEDSDDAAEDEEESNEASDKSSNESDEEDNSEEEEDDDDDGSDDDEEEDDDDDDDSGKRPKKRRKISASAATEAPIFVRKPGQKLKGAEFTHIAKPVEISTSTMIPGVVPPLPTGKKKARGNSCHQCKTRRTNNDLIGCGMIHIKKPTGIRIRKRKRERRCRKKYCERCLEKFYGEEAPEKIAPGLPNTYACPGCRGLCTCAACMRAGSKRKEVQDAVAAVQAGKPTPFVVKQMAAAAAAGASGHSVSAKGKGVKGKGKPAGNSSKSSTGGSKPSSTTSSPRVTSNGNPKKVQSKNGSSSGASTPTSKSSKKRVSEANGSTTKRVKQEASVDTASVDSPSNHITPVTTPKLMARSGGKGKIGLHHSTAPKLLPSSAPVSSNTSTTTAHMDDGDHHSHEDTDMHDEHVSSAVSHSADESIAHESEGDEEHHAQISPNPPMHQHVVDGTTFLSPRHGDTSCTPSSLLLNTHHHHHHARRTSPFQGGFDSYSPRPSYQSHLHSPQSAMRRMSQSARRQSLGLAALGLQPDLAELM